MRAKHAVKQVDRLLSNAGIDVWELFSSWVPFAIATRPEIVVAFDWTDFDPDDQTTIALHLITSHGRATPLLWRTVVKSQLRDRQARHETELLARLVEVMPHGLKVTVLADRGFGDQELYKLLAEWRVDYVIRFREIITVADEQGEARPARDWVPRNGRSLVLRNARVTQDRTTVPAVVCVRARKMKEAWCLATSRTDLRGSEIVRLHGRRFTIEEGFRDSKDLRFGMGLSSTSISVPARRDRLLLISAMTIALLALLGAAGESLGMDRWLKVNTVKKRTHSLFRQGCYYYDAIATMREDELRTLVTRFAELIAEHRVFQEVFALI